MSWLTRLVLVALLLSILGLFLLGLYLPWEGLEDDDDFPPGYMYEHSEEDCAGCVHRRDREPVYLPPEGETRYPIIVWWTPFSAFARVERECKEGTCLFTHSRTELDNPKTASFVFYGTDLDWKDLPLPRRHDVTWALLHEESPKNNWVLAQDKAVSLFNFTATCSRYSSYPLTTQYLNSLDWLLQPPWVATAEKSTGGLGLVVYIHSDCDPPSDRDSYVEELMKYIKVDSYGKCLHNKDLPAHLTNTLTFDYNDLYKIIAQYKFAIAFENALCHDYITEKFWRPLHVGSVPIVRGSPTIQDWAPDIERSIIVAEDFDSPRELAEYLKFLDRSTAEYEKYLEFKTTGITNPMLLEHMEKREWRVDYDQPGVHFIEGFECLVCDEIHRMKRLEERGLKMQRHTANQSHYHCLTPEPSLEFRGDTMHEKVSQMRKNARREMEFWRSIAMCAEVKADVVFETVTAGGTQAELSAAIDHTLC